MMFGTAAGGSLTLLGSGCTGARTKATGGNRRADEVTVMTGLGSYGREAAPMVAVRQGFFAQNGITCTVREGATGEENMAALNAGRVQFAVIDYASSLIRMGKGVAGAQGGDDDYRIVCAINQQSLVALMVFTDEGINRPQDLLGKGQIGAVPGAAPQSLFPTWAKEAGMAQSDIDKVKAQFVPVGAPDLIKALVAKRVIAVGQFVPGLPSAQQAAGGREVMALPYSRYITDLYGNVVVAKNSLIKSNPDLVHRFVGAILQGLAFMLANPVAAGAMVHSMFPIQHPVLAAAEITAMTPYCTGLNGGPLGGLDPIRVARGIAIIQGSAQIGSGLSPELVVADGFVGK